MVLTGSSLHDAGFFERALPHPTKVWIEVFFPGKGKSADSSILKVYWEGHRTQHTQNTNSRRLGASRELSHYVIYSPQRPCGQMIHIHLPPMYFHIFPVAAHTGQTSCKVHVQHPGYLPSLDPGSIFLKPWRVGNSLTEETKERYI